MFIVQCLGLRVYDSESLSLSEGFSKNKSKRNLVEISVDKMSWYTRRLFVRVSKNAFTDLIRTSIHHGYDSPEKIGAIPSEKRLTAPMPLEEIVFVMNTRWD